MPWTRSIARLAATAVLGLAAGATAATIVVRSNGPSAALYPPGKMLDAAGSVTLKAGDTLTVLDAGGTRVLTGVGKVAVAGRGATNAAGFGALLASTGVRQARTGATRSAGDGPPRPTNLWFVDGTRAGTTCVADPASTMLWRPRFDTAQTLTVVNAADGRRATLDYAAGQATRTWPAGVPLVEGASYRVEGAAAPVTVKVRLLPAAPATLDGAAEALIAKGCQNQVDLLVASTIEK